MTVASICNGLLLLALFSLALTLAAQATALWVASPRRRRRSAFAPPISVLKPVKGDDEALYENLVSFARQDYPDYELLVGAEDPRDPALAVARRVKADHPQARISILTGCFHLGLNPKVNLLAMLSHHARHEHLLISDSNVRVCPAYLRETVKELEDPGVGLVTNLLAGAETEGLGGALENLHLNSFVAAAGSFARVAGGRACVVGKSMLFRRCDLTRIGGFASVANVLAEDYLIGRKLELAGFEVAISPYVVATVNHGWNLERFTNRHLRWAQMRRRLCAPAYAGELLMNPVLWATLWAACSAAGRDRASGAIAAVAGGLVALKCAGDATLSRRLCGVRPRAAHLLLIPGKDLLMAALWAVGAFRRSINWRGNVMRIESGSRLVHPHLPAFDRPAREAA